MALSPEHSDALPEEAWLDALLLDLLASDADAVADVFAERSLHGAASCRVEPGLAGHFLPQVRAEAGVLARCLGRGALEARHVSGLEGARDPLSGRAAAELSAGLVAACAAVREIALDAVAREPRVLRLDVEVTAHERAFRVVSSEWGHAGDATSWACARFTVTARAGLEARVTRALGVPGLARLREEAGAGGRLEALAREAVAAALLRGEARPLTTSTPRVLLAPGAGGVLVHEAVGHALEGDVVERGASLFGGRMGERVAVPELSVVDDPTLPGLAGSLACDDEGAPARPRVLIEHGVLRGVLLDGMRSHFARREGGGHGRRATFRDLPLPRMANTCVLPTAVSSAELLAEIEDGVLVTHLARAAADPLTGDVHLRATEAFRIADGRIAEPLVEFGLAGNAAALLHGLDGIGDDLGWDDGGATCGREGQWVRVAVGTPTLRVAPGGLSVV